MSLLCRETRLANRQNANLTAARGSLERLGGFLCPDGMPVSFLISGGIHAEDRVLPLRPLLLQTAGTMPVIVLHSRDTLLREEMQDLRQYCDTDQPLWDISAGCSGLEPFYGMTDMQVIGTLRQLAGRLGYTPAPRFERTVRAHLTILRQLGVPISLSGLHYLCQFQDMGELYDNVMELPCGNAAALRLWADLGAEDDGREQFDLFRTVICSLAEEAQYSGWNPDGQVDECNCLTALRQNAALLLEVDELHTQLLLTYLAEELRTAGNQRFLLLLDGIPLRDERLLDYLRTAGGCYLGVLGESVPALLSGEEAAFSSLTQRMRCFVTLKHSNSQEAEWMSRLFGRFDCTRAEHSQGSSRTPFGFLPRDHHEDVRFSTENRYRIMPEEITALREGQAIVFLTDTDELVRYN